MLRHTLPHSSCLAESEVALAVTEQALAVTEQVQNRLVEALPVQTVGLLQTMCEAHTPATPVSIAPYECFLCDVS